MTVSHLHSIKILNLELSLDRNDINCTVEITPDSMLLYPITLLMSYTFIPQEKKISLNEMIS